MPARTQLRVGRLSRAHGLKGAIKVELYTDDPGRRFVPGARFALQVPTSSKWHGKSLELVELRVYNGSPVAFFKGVEDRTEAESLVKAVLWVEQDATELPAEPDAWYVHQLAGLEVHRDGERIGRVVRVDAMPGQDMLIIERAGEEVMVPFVKAIVPEVDLRAGRIVITPPPGLLEELEGDDVPEVAGASASDASAPGADDASAPEADDASAPDTAEPGADERA
ncbi:ribosome maturation factor RimM [Agrococcus sp. HG114]|uniref:ribosome maturation factor RimM n=1 Tax=Agrococcus sp. HG114 TaxID=2969757 RepID=UPI00215B67CA|nr:ribosome maturation factor RimM [Agrococcus sp. HG114]MCR8670461.1 ribosome maturation factor RimM [Agrococcus sp. HG114]